MKMGKFLVWTGVIGLCIVFPPLIFVGMIVYGFILLTD